MREMCIRSVTVLVIAFSTLTSSFARAQCQPQWIPQFAGGDIGGEINAMALFDEDGDGPLLPTLHCAGTFGSMGGMAAHEIAHWDGHKWAPLGNGFNGELRALTAFDSDGDGPGAAELYAGGSYVGAGAYPQGGIAKWNGSSWSSVGTGLSPSQFPVPAVLAFAVFDEDGPGPEAPALFVGGVFAGADGVTSNDIIKWDGANWTAVGGGVNGTVLALTVFDDDGPGPHLPALYVGGEFTLAGGVAANHLAKWDGSTWSAVGDANNSSVIALTSMDFDGAGPNPPVLFAAGDFSSIGGVSANRIAQWNGTSWSALGTGTNNWVRSMCPFDEVGDGPLSPVLVCGGDFTSAGGTSVHQVARWNGTSWSDVGGGVNVVQGDSESVHVLLVFDEDGAGPTTPMIYAGGYFQQAGEVNSSDIARWNGSNWMHLGNGLDAPVRTLTTWDPDGDGPNSDSLVVGGEFDAAGSSIARKVARWDGQTWSPIGDGMDDNVFSVQAFDEDGNGPQAESLFAAGSFTLADGAAASHIARWNGSSWTDVAGGIDGTVSTMTVFDDDNDGPHQPALFAGGYFTHAGGQSANFIAKWDGASWSSLGSGVLYNLYALTAYDDDGAGPHAPALIAVGNIYEAGGIPVNRVAKWDGQTWAPVGGGVGTTNDMDAFAATVYDEDGDGPALPALFVGGHFSTASGVPVTDIARWDGTSWSAVGTGFSGTIKTMTVFDEDGDGPVAPALYVGGESLRINGIAGFFSVARWDGKSWTQVNTSPALSVYAVHPFDGANGPALYVGGSFLATSGVPSQWLARWGEPVPIILRQPFDLTVDKNQEATFTVDAEGAAPLNFEWRRNGKTLVDGGNISGATTKSLVVSPASAADAGAYDVTVTNACGTAMSAEAQLTIHLLCIGDIAPTGGNGVVNSADLLRVLTSWGACSGCDADVNADGVVNSADLLTIINGWGPCP